MKILFVEDNKELAENLIEIFSSEGFDASYARSGEEARPAFHDSVLLFVIDLRLPDVSGLALLQEIKSLNPSAEVILLTGDADISSATAAVRAGAFAYLIKPVATSELLLTVERAREKVQLRLLSIELEVALRFSEHRYRTIVEMVPAAIVALDSELNIQFVNHTAEKITGYSREELSGRRFQDIFHFEAILTAQESEESFTNRNNQSFSILWRWTRSEPSRESKQSLLFYIGTDVTQLRRLERERQVTERLAVVGKMTAGLAHEIRNPLNAALLQLALLSRKQDKLPAETRASLQNHLGIVRGELERLNTLLTDFLSLAKPKEYQKNPLSLSSLLAHIISLQQEVAQQHKISLRLSSESQLTILGDSNALQQVFINLIKNALEAARSFVEVVAEKQGDKIIIRVSDDGPGISQENSEHIFEPFFTTKAQGTGLGLVIVHSIVLAHGGTISLSSPSSSGAIALVQLPCA